MPIGARDVEAMSAPQRAVHEAIAGGARGGVPAPFLAMLDAPELAMAVQAVGAALRFSGALSAAHREIAILATAAAFGSGYEWDYHLPVARREGVAEDVIAMAFSGRGDADPVAAAIVTLCWRAVRVRAVDPADLSHLVERLGRAAATEVVAIAGYYPALGLFLSAGALDHLPQPVGKAG